MQYGIIKKGVLQLAPRIIDHVLDPSDDVYIAHGYLPIITAEEPTVEQNQYAIPLFREENGRIVQSWTVEEVPISEEEALTRYANSITGADDPDLISAAETLITQRIKED